MVRRYYGRRRNYRRYGRKKTFRRRYRKQTRFSKKGQKLYLFKRFCDYGELTVSSLTGGSFAYNFSLNDLPNYTEFTSLYDMYKLNAVKITFIPQQTESISLGSINNANNVRFFSAIDYNDSSAPASANELREYQTCKVTSVFKQHKRYIYKPKILDSVSSSRTAWIATASPSTNHYGLKVWVDPIDSTTTTSMTYQVEAKLYLSFKQVK